MARVFISHATADRARAGQLHQWLAGEGHEVFLDHPGFRGIEVVFLRGGLRPVTG